MAGQRTTRTSLLTLTLLSLLAPMASGFQPLLSTPPPPHHRVARAAASQQQQSTRLSATPSSAPPSRRAFLLGGAALLGGAVLPGLRSAEALTVKERDELYAKALAEETASVDATKLPDDRAAKLFKEAQRAQQGGDIAKSLNITNTIIKDYPGFAYGWSNRGNLYVAMQKYEEALKDYAKAIELAPNGGETWIIYLNKGTTLALLGKDEEGIKDLTSGLALNPANNDRAAAAQEQILKVNRGLIQMKVGSWEAASRDFASGYAITPTQPDRWWVPYALCLYEGRKEEEAKVLLEKFDKRMRNPPSSDAKAALAAITSARGDREAAETYFSDVQRTKSYSSRKFLEKELHWPPKIIAAVAAFRGSAFSD